MLTVNAFSQYLIYLLNSATHVIIFFNSDFFYAPLKRVTIKPQRTTIIILKLLLLIIIGNNWSWVVKVGSKGEINDDDYAKAKCCASSLTPKRPRYVETRE